MMVARIIDGKAIAAEIRAGIKDKIALFRANNGPVPGLAVILVGEDPASQTYVRNKERACQAVGMHSEVYRLPRDTNQGKLLELIDELNGRSDIHGILVQLPVPEQIETAAIINAIRPEKDVDGFHPVNVGRLMVGEPAMIPGTPQGIMALLDHSGVELTGKKAVVVGRSNIVGKPVALLLLQRHATVTICHSRTKDLAGHTRQADVLVVATGRPGTITGEMVKEGAVVIDVGVNRVEGGLVGDVAFDEVANKAAAITPVPGGVGPMTITMLLQNTLQAATGVW
jgi:methylenetetrahydrofolate dehydrogenase (NADP+)/methenyltetrahydrofolate cyclohydrolase